tara:strand:+ start:11150 stop:12289 length:1140 start_codon:yes stop_codon:yes gene_type:complete
MKLRLPIGSLLVGGFLVALVALPAVARDRNRLRENREARWMAMPEDQRGHLRNRYDQFLGLDAAERASLEQQSDRLTELEFSVRSRLETPELEQLESLPNEQRRVFVNELVVEEARTTAQRILRKLPQDIRERLAQARPADRARALQNYKAAESKRIERAYRQLGASVGLSEDDHQKLMKQRPDKRRQSFVYYAELRVRAAVEAHGLPEGMAVEIWPRVEPLEGLEFLEAILWLREEYPELGGLESDTSEDLGPLVNERDALVRLRGTMRISERDRMRFLDASPADRERELHDLKRIRAMRVLREERLVSLTMLQDLDQATDREFMLQLRRILSGQPVPESMGRQQPARHAGPPGRSPDPGSKAPVPQESEPNATEQDG